MTEETENDPQKTRSKHKHCRRRRRRKERRKEGGGQGRNECRLGGSEERELKLTCLRGGGRGRRSRYRGRMNEDWDALGRGEA